MHIPPYYKKTSWQRFFAGVFIGAILAFPVFLFMYGTLMEQRIEENVRLQSELTTLEDNYEILNKDKEELNEQQKKSITVQSIEINFINEKKLLSEHKLDRLSVYKLRDMVRKQLPDTIGQNISSLSENTSLIYSSIENRSYQVDDSTYEVKVERLVIAPTFKVSLKIDLVKN
ncbi:sporulation membrane protein YtrI [Pontibacillus salipaludis]|uniref:Sporulation membrane protein YtrI n=1 Tax=Pontibacillus salipaludis TaxID=1697394 RepID=A0ABQ1Q772_9BACI|nr:sporulation membrane protein YtrI [Pontibacillus salipaludis]GGD16895.1 sporulation membrane protein YtrI [Pontibacillus salipaludis]